MFTKKDDTPSPLDAEIAVLLSKLDQITAKDSDEYATIIERLTELHKLKPEVKASAKLSPDTALAVAANIAGILMIIHHERVGVLTSRAIGFIIKP